MGQSAHPKGRKCRARRLADLLRQIGNEEVTFRDGPQKGQFDFGEVVEVSVMSRRERMARVLWTEALDGNLKAMQLLAETMDGRPMQPVAVGVEARFTADEYAQAALKLMAWKAERIRDASNTTPAAGKLGAGACDEVGE